MWHLSICRPFHMLACQHTTARNQCCDLSLGCNVQRRAQVKAGVPERLMELALVSVAHFEPVEVQVLIEGTYPMLTLNLPRIKDDAFRDALSWATSRCVFLSLPADR